MSCEQSFALIARQIDSRDAVYEQTWKKVPIEDLIAVARLKTFRASTMLRNGSREKLIDDLVDAAAYIIFALERLQEGEH